MKSLMKSLKRQDGFTLVELMVVVAIIGLLSAVAIPNFKKYQAKAKMSEAKLQLSAVYTAETAFFSDYNIYAQCLTYMGYDPIMEMANRYYAVGFDTAATIEVTAYASAVNSGLNSTDCPRVGSGRSGDTAPTSNDSMWFPAGKGIGGTVANLSTFLPASTIGDQATGANMTFTAGAGGVISENFTAADTTSRLQITQAKVLTVVGNGF